MPAGSMPGRGLVCANLAPDQTRSSDWTRGANSSLIWRNDAMRKISALILGATLGLGSAAGAQSLLVAGQVIRVDQSSKKITIKHGPVPRLDIEDGMTIVYAAPDSNMLKTVKIGDKVNFEAERVGGQYVLTKIEKAK